MGESVGVSINVCVIICEQVKKSKTIAIFDYFPGLQTQLFQFNILVKMFYQIILVLGCHLTIYVGVHFPF